MAQISLRKQNANRKNALQSTGPRTPEGKQKVRWNALQHGLLAQEVIIPTGPGQEDDEEFENLLTALRDDLQPSGALEEILVEKIAVCYWRLRRVLRAENGEIRSGLDDAPRSFRLRLTTQAVFATHEGLEQPSQLQANSFGLEALLEYLTRLQGEVAEKNPFPMPPCACSPSISATAPTGLPPATSSHSLLTQIHIVTARNLC